MAPSAFRPGRSGERPCNHRAGTLGLAGLGALLAALGLSLVSAGPAGAQPTTFYVAADGSNAGNDCTSSANPCATISYALTYATTYGDTVHVAGTIDDSPTVPNQVTVTGADAPAASPAVISGDVVLWYSSTLADLTVDGGVRAMGADTVTGTSVIGGGIAAQEGLTVTASTISGGGIDAQMAEVTVSYSTISGGGDGIDLEASNLTVSNSTISGNEFDGIHGEASGYGFSTAGVSNSTILGNGEFGIDDISETSVSDSSVSDNGGGGITGVYGPLRVTNSTVSDNGGAGITWGDCYNIFSGGPPVPFVSCPVTVADSTVTGNKGDGIDAEMGDPTSSATISGSTISANAGVGINAEQGAVVSASMIEGNQGGGLYVNAGVSGFLAGNDINISGNTISGNTAPAGGGMYICECAGLPSDIVISGNAITGNRATDGGGIYLSSPFGATISDNTIAANIATNGGGIYNVGDVTITLSTFSGNVASQSNVVDNAAAAGTPVSTVWAAADIFDGSCQNMGAWRDGGYNVGSDGSCLNGGAGDVKYGASLSANGLLGPLAQNGGLTETLLPLAGNPAIEIVPSGTSVVLDATRVTLCPVTDQRGVTSSPSVACTAGSVQVSPTTLHLNISAPYQDNGVTVVSLWWASPPGASSFSLTADEKTAIGVYSYTATGLPQSRASAPFIVQVEGATELFGSTFQVTDNLGDVSNPVSYP